MRFPSLPAGKYRHPDHRFEWTRAEFRTWSTQVADRYGYSVEFRPVGLDDPEVGPPTQLAVFARSTPVAEPRARTAAVAEPREPAADGECDDD
ncbi:hypothetical protein JOF29_007881 [Kribbella aluminosa]|uniref:Small RNA 2'-O-methyltransferase n=1 Tax=Kribbella aluminosa TaxID=416017 RepID=A0ABS4UZ01_9ACTN|nr:hypothetical protein [Kribbella aluminosa]MBP2356771.1 hypothetical protein [Kribbella aluminosa]